jgi:methanogenic corrinoid protein MtbC1
VEQQVEPSGRRELAAELRRRRDRLAEPRRVWAVPEDAGLRRDVLDALAAAVELGSPGAFAHHVRATAATLRPRGLPQARLVGLLGELEHQLGALPPHPAEAARPALDAARLAVGAATSASDERVPRAPARLARERDLYLDAAVAGRRHAALAVVERALADGHRLHDVYTDVVAEALYEVGRRWAADRLTVMDEHLASAVTGYVLTRLYMRFTPRGGRGAAVVACPPGEAHQLGAHVVADALELDGWDVRFLGANTPPRAVADAVEDAQASLVALSMATLPAAAHGARLIERLRVRFGSDAPRIVVGGLVLRAVPDLWRPLGADAAGADVRDAVRAARAAGA